MKKILFFFFCALLLLSGTACKKQNLQNTNQTPLPEETNLDKGDEPVCEIINYRNIKAMWLSQFDLQNIYTNLGKQRAENDFKTKISTILDNVKENGFNTVFLQVRPYADSFYPSSYYPPSKYVTGSYSNSFSYDPIKIIIDEAHKRGLSIHAWINPLRAMNADEIKEIDESFIIKKWYKDNNGTFLVLFNGRYYLNPAYSETRQLIIDGVKEIIDNYSFDGVHMDDYFYPTTSEEFDSLAFTEYKTEGGTLSLKKYRYSNLNKLISGIYSTVKEKNNALLYGISPEGNISNATDKAYADVYTWCSEKGYIDYICPQIYFGLKHQTYPFDKTVENWGKTIKNPDIKLIIGMTFGKALSKTDKWAGSGKDEWNTDKDIMKRCLEYTKENNKCTGVSVFSYQYYFDPLTNVEISETKSERDSFTLALKEIQWK